MPPFFFVPPLAGSENHQTKMVRLVRMVRCCEEKCGLRMQFLI